MPRQKQSPATFSEPNIDQVPLGPVGGPAPQQITLGPGGGPPDHFFHVRGPGGPPGQQGPLPHLNSSAGSPFGPGPNQGMPPPPQSQLNHDFLDDLIQPVTGNMENISGPNDGGLGPGPNHLFDSQAHFMPPQSSSVYTGPPMGGPVYNRMPGPGGPMGPPGSGKVYPINQSMVFNPSNPNAPPIYPCGVCHKEVHDNDQAILCESGCNFWFHRSCTGLSEPAFTMLKEEVYAEWVCDKCLSSKNIPLVKLKP